MSTITLNNRVTSYSDSDAAFVSCTALPIQQTTLNIEEMAGIDGLWDWGDFGSKTLKGATLGAVGAVAGLGVGLKVGLVAPPVTVKIVVATAVAGAVGGALLSALDYTYDELTSD